jgi:hypothetical protein
LVLQTSLQFFFDLRPRARVFFIRLKMGEEVDDDEDSDVVSSVLLPRLYTFLASTIACLNL